MKRVNKEKVISLAKAILVTVGILGFVTLGALAGNAVQLLKFTPIGGRRSKIKTYEINQSIRRLLDRGLLKISENKDSKYLEVTDKGKHLLLKHEIEGLVKNKPKKWDKKYRIVVFDVPEVARKIRDRLRRTLQSFGFVRIQESVWVYPYECQEIIMLLKKYLGISGEAIYITAESIENDKWLKEIFEL